MSLARGYVFLVVTCSTKALNADNEGGVSSE